ncbi:regulator of hypoxia-inducible factor 1-like [Hyposmocoma kahamanoa]|uniref:regulator of hypoxia-inducible factor 1-like n=1 Tax=Hyposmocoma kahamanoa TaxID=1477025 RepID=UPI000E6D9C06|nr:regulator of hypoxia-inducible factor 1-like [Hyposmocoma kahamanoa]
MGEDSAAKRTYLRQPKGCRPVGRHSGWKEQAQDREECQNLVSEAKTHLGSLRHRKSEYARMPPLFQYDNYESCLRRPGGLYCTTKFDLVADEPNELYDLIQEYSSYWKINFNHSRLQYGICVTDTCKDFYNNNTTSDVKLALEGYLNKTFYDKYRLRTRVKDSTVCTSTDEPKNIDSGDIFVAVICLLILLLNIAGTLYDVYWKTNKSQEGNKFLECFSLQRNWQCFLSSTGAEGRLKALDGVRCVIMLLVLLSHSAMPVYFNSDNPHFLENLYQNELIQIVSNGSLVMQVFFISSGFLLVYNMEHLTDQLKIWWIMLPKGILLRWLRLMPPYAFVLAITATWMRFAGSGPLWQDVVTSEANDCKRDWWYFLLNVNNYVDSTSCMIEFWYVAADFQLTIVGLMTYLMVPKSGRIIAFSILFIIGLFTPAVTTYMLNLDPVLVPSPEALRSIFKNDSVMNHVYKRAHTNIACYAMGLISGLMVYRWQKTGLDFHKFIKNRYLYYALFPTMLAISLSGSAFYWNDYSRLVRAIYGTLVKPIFGAAICAMIIAMFFKYEGFYRGILEWSGWSVLWRLAYCAYCLHFTVIRGIAGSSTRLTGTSIMELAQVLATPVVLSILLAVPLWLFVEAPFGQLVRLTIRYGGYEGAGSNSKEIYESEKYYLKNEDEKTKTVVKS